MEEASRSLIRHNEHGNLRKPNFQNEVIKSGDAVELTQSLFLALGALVRPGVNFQAHCRNFRRRVKKFRRTASNTRSSNPKRIVTLQKERLWIRVAIRAYSSSIEHNENKYKNQNIHAR